MNCFTSSTSLLPLVFHICWLSAVYSLQCIHVFNNDSSTLVSCGYTDYVASVDCRCIQFHNNSGFNYCQLLCCCLNSESPTRSLSLSVFVIARGSNVVFVSLINYRLKKSLAFPTVSGTFVQYLERSWQTQRFRSLT